MIDYEVNSSDLADFKRRLGEYADQGPRLAAGMINRAIKHRRTQLRRGVQKRLNLKAKSINRSFRVGRATSSHLEGRVVAKEKHPPNLADFKGTRQRKKSGVIAKVLTGGSAEEYPHAFLQTLGNGHRLVLRRIRLRGILAPLLTSGGRNTGRRSRYPLKGVRGLSPVEFLQTHKQFTSQQVEGLADDLSKNLDGAIQGYLDRRRKAAEARGKAKADAFFAEARRRRKVLGY